MEQCALRVAVDCGGNETRTQFRVECYINRQNGDNARELINKIVSHKRQTFGDTQASRRRRIKIITRRRQTAVRAEESRKNKHPSGLQPKQRSFESLSRKGENENLKLSEQYRTDSVAEVDGNGVWFRKLFITNGSNWCG